MTHRVFGESLHASERTSLRWAAGRSQPTVGQVHTLAALVHPRDPMLADELARACSTTLEALGIAQPALPAAPRPRPIDVVGPRMVADLVVCAAAEAIGVAPGVARVAVAAALARMKELELSVDDAARGLVPPAARTKDATSLQIERD